MSYTDKEVARITELSPVTYEVAVALAKEFGKTPKSVISKVQHLGLEYVKKEVAPKKVAPETKAEIVKAIEASTGLTLPTLANASVATLVALREYVLVEEVAT